MTAEIGDGHRPPLQKKHFIIATAGHVDHGKSSLVKALTGTDPDRLPEEKARQITIDLGFAELALSDDVHAAIIDVPGHEDFIGNMIAGVGSVDLALLTVAADDGWMPQTEEHLQILNYLGVTRAVVALTKSDIGNAATAELQIRDRLRNTSFAGAPIVRTALQNSTGLTGQVCGLPALKDALASELSQTAPQRDIAKPRLFIDRVFTLRGVGTIVTGTLTGGTLRVGDSVTVQPNGRSARIRSIQSHNRFRDTAEVGTRIALSLPELTPDVDVHRGDVITTAEFTTASSFLAAITRASGPNSSAPLKSGASAFLHHGSSRIAAKVLLRNRDKLLPGEYDTAEIRTASPLLAFVGDRFVLRDPSQRHTLAGGVIVGRTISRATIPTDADVDLCAGYEIEASRANQQSDLLKHSRFANAEVSDAVVRLSKTGNVLVRRSLIISPVLWREIRTHVLTAVTSFHATHPDRPGIQLGELRSSMAGYPPGVIDAVLEELISTALVASDSIIALRSHEPALPNHCRDEANRLLDQLAIDPRNPPAPNASRTVVMFLVKQGAVVELAPDVLLSARAFAEMKNDVLDFLRCKQRATASELRQALRTSRRIVIPFLETLDRQRVTRRVGDQRTLASPVHAAKIS